MNYSKNKIFGNWDFYKLCISVAVPVMAQQLIMGMVSLIDNFMVAGLGGRNISQSDIENIFSAIENGAERVNFIGIEVE